MVNPIILVLLGIGVVAFLGLGGVEKGSDLINKISRKTSSPISQLTKKIAGGSAQEIITSEQSFDVQTSGVMARRGKSRNPTELTTTTNTGKKFRRAVASGAITEQTNISGGRRISLSAAEIARVRARPLTSVEERDVLALTNRFNRKSSAKQRLKTDPLELVLQKREQELISKKVIGESKFVDGKLFGKRNFALGGKTAAQDAADRARARAPTIGKSGQIIENLGAGGSAIIKKRNQDRVAAALAFNAEVARKKLLEGN